VGPNPILWKLGLFGAAEEIRIGPFGNDDIDEEPDNEAGSGPSDETGLGPSGVETDETTADVFDETPDDYDTFSRAWISRHIKVPPTPDYPRETPAAVMYMIDEWGLEVVEGRMYQGEELKFAPGFGDLDQYKPYRLGNPHWQEERAWLREYQAVVNGDEDWEAVEARGESQEWNKRGYGRDTSMEEYLELRRQRVQDERRRKVLKSVEEYLRRLDDGEEKEDAA